MIRKTSIAIALALCTMTVAVRGAEDRDAVDEGISSVEATPGDVACDAARTVCNTVESIRNAPRSLFDRMSRTMQNVRDRITKEDCSETGCVEPLSDEDRRLQDENARTAGTDPSMNPYSTDAMEAARREEAARVAAREAEEASTQAQASPEGAAQASDASAVGSTPAATGAATEDALAALDLLLETSVDEPVSYGFPHSGANAFEVVRGPSSGTLEITDPATGAFKYTPAPGYQGQDTFTFVALNGAERSNQGLVTVSILPAGQQYTLETDRECEAEWLPLLPGKWRIEGDQGGKQDWAITIPGPRTRNDDSIPPTKTWQVEETFVENGVYTQNRLASGSVITKGDVYVYSEKQTRAMCGFSDSHGFYFDEATGRIYWSRRELYLKKD